MAPSNVHAQHRAPYEAVSLPAQNFIKPPESEEERSIEFLHPCDPKGHSILLRLPALDVGIPSAVSSTQSSTDRQATPSPVWGLDHETARIACGILADNRWDGYFTSFNGQRVEDGTQLLVEQRYFFNVPDTSINNGNGTDTQYPVVRDFDSWRFPKDDIPLRWCFSIPRANHHDNHSRSLSRHSSIDPSDCVVTTANHVLHNAHIIPSSQSSWFNVNKMGDYPDTSSPNINNVANRLPLRADVHNLLDNSRFCIVPKAADPDGASSSGIKIPEYNSVPSEPKVHLVLHVLRPDNRGQLFALYHNVSLQPLKGIKSQYLFAAFAEKVFQLCRYFSPDDIPRPGVVFVRGDVDEGRPNSYEIMPVAVPSRTKSPTKKDGRKRSRTEDNTDDSINSTDSTDSEETEDDVYNSAKKRKYNLSPTLEERGRTLTRRGNMRTPTRPSNVRTSSTVTSAGARTPTSSEDDKDQHDKYSYHISVTAPTKEEAWENEDIWERRQKRW